MLYTYRACWGRCGLQECWVCRFHGKVDDTAWPQTDQAVRFSSPWPDWPLGSNHVNYAQIYHSSSPNAYSWQYSDMSSIMECCGTDSGPNYQVVFCP
jgi:hypothetical protein